MKTIKYCCIFFFFLIVKNFANDLYPDFYYGFFDYIYKFGAPVPIEFLICFNYDYPVHADEWNYEIIIYNDKGEQVFYKKNNGFDANGPDCYSTEDIIPSELFYPPAPGLYQLNIKVHYLYDIDNSNDEDYTKFLVFSSSIAQLNKHYSPPFEDFSTKAIITTEYEPDDNHYYLNIFGKINDMQSWIAKNIYIPDKSWASNTQQISKRFDLSQFGIAPGQQVDEMSITFTKLKTITTEIPVGLSYFKIPVSHLNEDAGGESTPVPEDEPQIPEIPQEEFTPTDTVIEVTYRGCRVPNIDLDNSSHPATAAYAGDKNACGPASAANSLKWLSDVSDKVDIQDDHRTVLEELSGFMGRTAGGGVTIEQFVKGKLDYIKAKGLPINVKFQSENVIGRIYSSDSSTFARNDNTAKYPTWDWMKAEVDSGEDVEALYYYQKDGEWRGHAVVISGMEESADGRLNIKFKHDANQADTGGTKQEDDRVLIDNYGRIIMERGAYIGHVIAESPGDPLPVELSLFSYKIVDGTVCLIWRTESEINNYGFEIERTPFQNSPGKNWEKVGFVKGAGSVTERNEYSFIDKDIFNGKYYYRLKQIDFDGSYKYSGTLEVDISHPLQFEFAQNYPNPFNPVTTIKYGLPVRSHVTIEVFNTLGERIVQLTNEIKEAGFYELKFDADGLASGIYFYSISAKSENGYKNFRSVKKMLLIK